MKFRIFFPDNTRVRILILFCRAKRENFFPDFNIRFYEKNSESEYFFFLHQNQNILFQQHWESEYLFRERPPPPPPPPPRKLNGPSLILPNLK